MIFPCEKCGGTCRTKRTSQASTTLKLVDFVCDNYCCGYAFIASVQPLRELSPSSIEKPVAYSGNVSDSVLADHLQTEKQLGFNI